MTAQMDALSPPAACAAWSRWRRTADRLWRRAGMEIEAQIGRGMGRFLYPLVYPRWPPRSPGSLPARGISAPWGGPAKLTYDLPMAVDHYENFPVASLLLPRRLRPAVRAIYRYARSADDIADE